VHIKKMFFMLGEKTKAGFYRVKTIEKKKKVEDLFGIF